jgi:hypothetical protein
MYVIPSGARDMAATKAFFRSATTTSSITLGLGHHRRTRQLPAGDPDRVGQARAAPTSYYLTNKLIRITETSKVDTVHARIQVHPISAARFCRGYDECRTFLRLRSPHQQPVSANHLHLHYLCSAMMAVSILAAA